MTRLPLLTLLSLLLCLSSSPSHGRSTLHGSPNPFEGLPSAQVTVDHVRAAALRAALQVAPSLAEAEERAVQAMEGLEMSCSECRTDLGILEGLIANNASRAAILAFANSKCEALNKTQPVIQACEAAAKLVIDDVLPWVLQKLSSPPYDTLAVCAFFGKCKVDCCLDQSAPEQVHLSFGNDSASMAVTWTTQSAPSGGPAVRWGRAPDKLTDGQAAGDTHTYTFAGWNGMLHGAVMTGLAPNTTYYYQVGAPGQWTDGQTYRFRTMPAAPPAGQPYPRAVRVAVIGDIGLASSNSTRNALVALAQAGEVDAVLLNGDGSYADGAQAVWDEFMRWFEPVASAVPLMTTPGNHEVAFVLGKAYTARYFMPHVTAQLNGTVADSQGNFYYSFNVGPVHFNMLSTESVLDTPYVYPTGAAFVRADLARANQPAARAAQPWVVAAGHRPLYCSDANVQCEAFAAYLRSELETTYMDNAVDLVFGAHRHSYSRSWPLYRGQVRQRAYNGTSAPTYVLNGCAGNREGLDAVAPADWLAAGAGWDFHGYGVLEATADRLTYTQYNADNSTVADTFTMTK